MGKPGRVCSVCADPAVAFQVDELILRGDQSLAQIATQLNLSRFAVSRHSRHTVSKLSDAAVEKLPENRLTTLYNRTEQLYSALAAAGDIGKASEILKIQTRLATALAEREEKQQEDRGVQESNCTHTPEWFDSLVAKVRKYEILSDQISCSSQERCELLTQLEDEFIKKQRELYPGITDEEMRPELERCRRYEFFQGRKFSNGDAHVDSTN